MYKRQDHHRPDQHLPPAVAVLDPKREDCPYPYKELTGCGVGFKLLQALCEQGMGDEEVLYQQLDLLVVSIAADIVHITGAVSYTHLDVYKRQVL